MKLKFTLLIIFLFVSSFYLVSMPPNPDIKDKTNHRDRNKDYVNKFSKVVTNKLNGMMKSASTSGTVRVLVILIGYSNMAMDAGSNPAFYSDLFNENVDPTRLTFNKYFKDMSNNTLDLQFDCYGPYAANNIYQYYGKNDSAGFDLYPGTLAGEAVDKAVNDIHLAGRTFADYDSNGDGEVDIVIVIHAGGGEESGFPSDRIWSHMWDLNSAKISGDGIGQRTYDGKKINDYTMQPEFNFAAGDSTIGVFAHEFGHALGLYDLYDIDYNTDGVGTWSLMAAGSWNGNGLSRDGSVPAPLLAREKMQLGWITVTDLVSGSINNPVTDIEDSHIAYKASTGYSYSGDEQYFLIENKCKEADNYWNSELLGDGLLITLIDEYYINSAKNYNRINSEFNNITNAHGVTVIEADAPSNNKAEWDLWIYTKFGNNLGSSTDTYPNVILNNLTPTSTPNSYRNDYSTYTSSKNDKALNKNVFAGLGFLAILLIGITFTTIFGRKKGLRGIMFSVLLAVCLMPGLLYFTACIPPEQEKVTKDKTTYIEVDRVNSGVSIYNISAKGDTMTFDYTKVP